MSGNLEINDNSLISSDDEDVYTGLVTKKEIVQRLKNYGIHTEENIKLIKDLRPAQPLTIDQINFYMDLFKRFSSDNLNVSSNSTSDVEFNDTLSEMEAFLQERTKYEPQEELLNERLKKALMSISVFPLYHNYEDDILDKSCKEQTDTCKDSKIVSDCSERISNDHKDSKTVFEDRRDSKTVFDDRRDSKTVFDDRRDSKTVFDDHRDSKTVFDDRRDSKIVFEDPRDSKTVFEDRRDSETVFDDRRDSKTVTNDSIKVSDSFEKTNSKELYAEEESSFELSIDVENSLYNDYEMDNSDGNIKLDASENISRKLDEPEMMENLNESDIMKEIDESEIKDGLNESEIIEKLNESEIVGELNEPEIIEKLNESEIIEKLNESEIIESLNESSEMVGKFLEVLNNSYELEITNKTDELEIIKTTDKTEIINITGESEVTKKSNLENTSKVDSNSRFLDDSLEKNMKALFSRSSEAYREELNSVPDSSKIEEYSYIKNMSSFSVFNFPGFLSKPEENTSNNFNVNSSGDVTNDFPGFQSKREENISNNFNVNSSGDVTNHFPGFQSKPEENTSNNFNVNSSGDVTNDFPGFPSLNVTQQSNVSKDSEFINDINSYSSKLSNKNECSTKSFLSDSLNDNSESDNQKYSFDADKSSSETQTSESYEDNFVSVSQKNKILIKHDFVDVTECNSYRSDCFDSISEGIVSVHKNETGSDFDKSNYFDSIFINDETHENSKHSDGFVPDIVVTEYTEDEIKYFRELYEKSNERLKQLQDQLESLDKKIEEETVNKSDDSIEYKPVNSNAGREVNKMVKPIECEKEIVRIVTPKTNSKIGKQIINNTPKNCNVKDVTPKVTREKLKQYQNQNKIDIKKPLKPEIFKTPIKTPKMSKRLKNIESPISRYIQESPMVPLKQNIVQRTTSPIICTAQRPFSVTKITPTIPPKISPIKFSPLPVKSYKPAKNIKITPVMKENKLPRNIEKVITIPKRAEIIKHSGRVNAQNRPLTSKNDNLIDSNLIDSKLEESLVTDLDATRHTEVSIMISSEAIIKKH